MKLETFMFADAAAAPGGKLYIHGGGFTRIQPPAIPWTHPSLTLVLVFSGSPEDVATPHELSIALKAPDGSNVFEPMALAIGGTNMTLVSEDEQTLHNVTATLGGLPFKHEGLYELELMLDGEPLASKPLPVVVLSTEKGGISQSSAAE